MSIKYKLPTKTALQAATLENELKALRRKVLLANDGYQDLLSRTYVSFRTFMTTLGKPRFKFAPIVKGNNNRSLDYYNETRADIHGDVRAAEEEVDSLSQITNEAFNYGNTITQELASLVRQTASQAQDLAIIRSEGLPGSVMVAGDDFTDRTLVDPSFVLNVPQCYLNTRQGILSLSRTSTIDVLDPGTTEVSVTPTSPNWLTREPTPGNLDRFYEGKFYALAGYAEPEGGQWHLEEITERPAEGEFYFHEHIRTHISGRQGRRFREEPYLLETEGEPGAIIGTSLDGEATNQIIVRDRGATEEERKHVRKNMVDGNPDTYWQCEWVRRPFSEDTDLRGEGATTWTAERMEGITPESLRAAAIDVDEDDFEISVVLTLRNPETINWVTLNPMNFGETTWLKIRSVETTEGRGGEWEQLPDFNNQVYQNILTEDVNSELTGKDVSYTLSPSKYEYRGQGIWTFPERQVQAIRFRIMQEVPVPVLYQRLQTQMTRVYDKYFTQHYSSESRTNFQSDEIRREWTRLIKLSYLHTIMVSQGMMDAGRFLPATTLPTETTTSTGSGHTVGRNIFDYDFPMLHPYGAIARAFGLGSGTTRKKKKTTTETDTGWVEGASWLQVYYDLIAYRIGIKDIQIMRSEYAAASELVTRGFHSPIEIRKVVLKVDDIIPEGTGIEYYISPNGGDAWHQINPMDKPSIYASDGYPVPKIVEFNHAGDAPNEQKYIMTQEPVMNVRLKILMTTTNASVTPGLKSYRLLLYPAESFRRLEIEI